MIRWAATRPSVVGAFTAGLLLSGVLAFTKLPLPTQTTDALPRLAFVSLLSVASPHTA